MKLVESNFLRKFLLSIYYIVFIKAFQGSVSYVLAEGGSVLNSIPQNPVRKAECITGACNLSADDTKTPCWLNSLAKLVSSRETLSKTKVEFN